MITVDYIGPSRANGYSISQKKGGYPSYTRGHVDEYMSKSVHTVEADASILELARRFIEGSYRRFPVVEDARLVGQISRRDILRVLKHLW